MASTHAAAWSGIALAVMLAGSAAGARQPTLEPLPAVPTEGRWLPLHVGGRAVPAPGAHGGIERQWPGSYVEGRFRGRSVDLVVGTGEVSLRVRLDDEAPVPLVRPRAGVYRVTAASPGAHRIRIDVASESQAGPTRLDGVLAPPGTQPLAAPPARRRQIEFIGDSHTVGYGNTSPTTACTEAAVWQTTDTGQGPAALTAQRYDADYQVNAISGRGMVRNYDGMAATTLPAAYPFALFDGKTPASARGWTPQVIVIGLGTNDFSTALKPGEPWTDRAALHADYERRYVAFVRSLRTRHPRALIVLWATDLADGEIAREAGTVAARLRQGGDRRVVFVPVTGLGFHACHGHPDRADDRAIAAALARAIDAQPAVWPQRATPPAPRGASR